MRLSQDPTGPLAGVLYAVPDIPQHRGDKVTALEKMDVAEMTESELQGVVSAFGLLGCKMVHVRQIDLLDWERCPILDLVQQHFPVRGYCTGLTRDGYRGEANYVSVDLQIPLLEKYTDDFDSYIRSRYGLPALALRDRTLHYATRYRGEKGMVVRIPGLDTWTVPQREETLAALSFCEDRIHLPPLPDYIVSRWKPGDPAGSLQRANSVPYYGEQFDSYQQPPTTN